MGISGLDIFKLLPKTNCRECGFPTCLAFAMQLAAKKIELEKCPYVTEEAKKALEEAARPPIIPVTVGTGDFSFTIGEETVLYRHEKRFEHRPSFAYLISDSMEDSQVDEILNKIKVQKWERVGELLQPNSIYLKSEEDDVLKYINLVEKVASNTELSLILVNENLEAIEKVLQSYSDRKPLIGPVTKDNIDDYISLAKLNSCPILIKGESLEELIQLTTKASDEGLKEIVLDSSPNNLKEAFDHQIYIRRSALEKKNQALGYPTIVYPFELTDVPIKESVIAGIFVAKYAGIIVMKNVEPESLFPLLILTQNIYTDPQRPMSVEEKIYPIGNPDEKSPVLITTNFSLTYFLVSGEVEGSKVPTWLLIMDTEGQSVLTSWAAGKFIAEEITKFIKGCKIEEKVSHKNLVIPGYVAQISGELEDESGWKVTVGPREAVDIPKFLQSYKVA